VSLFAPAVSAASCTGFLSAIVRIEVMGTLDARTDLVMNEELIVRSILTVELNVIGNDDEDEVEMYCVKLKVQVLIIYKIGWFFKILTFTNV
jgi:hypothetical protein